MTGRYPIEDEGDEHPLREALLEARVELRMARSEDIHYGERMSSIRHGVGTAVVPMSSADAELPLVAGSLRALAAAGWNVLLVPPGDVDSAVSEATGHPVVLPLAAGWC